MITNLISLYSRIYDKPDEVCKLQAKSLQMMRYEVQTALCISKIVTKILQHIQSMD